jgi:hypothetical protein
VKKELRANESALDRLNQFSPPPFKLTVMHIEGIGTTCRMCSRRQSMAVPLVLILSPLQDGYGFKAKVESALCFDCYDRLREVLEKAKELPGGPPYTLPSLAHLKLQGRYAEGTVSFDAKNPWGEAALLNQLIKKMYCEREDPFIIMRQDFPLAQEGGSPNMEINPQRWGEEKETRP